MYEEELYHHGVMGMHWGVRRNNSTSGSNSTSSGKKKEPFNKMLSGAIKKYNTPERRSYQKQVTREVAKSSVNYARKQLTNGKGSKARAREALVKSNGSEGKAIARTVAIGEGKSLLKRIAISAGAMTLANMTGNPSVRAATQFGLSCANTVLAINDWVDIARDVGNIKNISEEE